MANTFQSGIKQGATNIENYSFFLGGMNTKRAAMEQYDFLRTGYTRIFFIHMPDFLNKRYPDETKRFKHRLEYANTAIDGLQNIELEFEDITAGFSGRTMQIPTVARDATNEITVRMYESAGSPIREYLTLWITGISDIMSGFTHYHGALGTAGIRANAAYHIAEAIVVSTDSTGRTDGIEYCALLTNMMPKSVKMDQFNYESGQHAAVPMDVQFTCSKYESADINAIGKALMTKYTTLYNMLDMKSGYSQLDIDAMPRSKVIDWNMASSS